VSARSSGAPGRGGAPGNGADAGNGPALAHELAGLLALERELSELSYVRRADALERVADTVRRLGELAPGEELPVRAAAELGRGSEFGRVLISEVNGEQLTIVAAWERDGDGDELMARLRAEPVRLSYPVLEREVVRDRTARIVEPDTAHGAFAWAKLLDRRSYAVAALVADPETIGLVHADDGDRQLDELDREVLARFAVGLSGVLERAVLRHTLELHRAELSAAAQWMAGAVRRLDELGGEPTSETLAAAESRALESLTTREAEVLRLLARGLSNRQIAQQLVVREGTIKYHVKNILRKLGAAGRADAVSRYLRATGLAQPRMSESR
jgi:LuxR family transcriptional regulator, regulator of acetate metabolism